MLRELNVKASVLVQDRLFRGDQTSSSGIFFSSRYCLQSEESPVSLIIISISSSGANKLERTTPNLDESARRILVREEWSAVDLVVTSY